MSLARLPRRLLPRRLLLQHCRLHSSTHNPPPSPEPSSTLHPSPEHVSAPAEPATRLDGLRSAQPFSAFLTDRFARRHTYLRISITERCNLRCTYCMPAEGVQLSPAAHLLTTPEIVELAAAFVAEGVTKIRLTGGEPTVRRDVVELVEALGALRGDAGGRGLRELAMTSNGVALPARRLDRLVAAGLTGLNLSLDTLVPAKFQFVTRRQGLDRVLAVVEHATARLSFGAPPAADQPPRTLKINVVVMRGVNDDELCDFVALTQNLPLEVRFIEYMPFDGNKWAGRKMLPYAEMLATIRARHPSFAPLPTQRPHDTAKTFRAAPGWAGTVGFITSMTHNFCATCNRLRVTCDGNVKACLFGRDEVSLRDILRRHRASPDQPPLSAGPARDALRRQLLEAVGGAVARKEAGHQPAADLAAAPNRPMILIDDRLQRARPAISLHLLAPSALRPAIRHYSSLSPPSPSLSSSPSSTSAADQQQELPHLTPAGEARMVPIHDKPSTTRTAVAEGHIHFSNPTPLHQLTRQPSSNKKGDVLAVARISGIMAAKRCSDLVVLCHPIALSSVHVEVVPLQAAREAGQGEGREGEGRGGEWGGVRVRARVTCEGKTGVEMEALAGVMGAALAVVDMCKAVDKRIVVRDVRVVEKRGGRGGDFVLGE